MEYKPDDCATCSIYGIGEFRVIDTLRIRRKYLQFCPCTIGLIDSIEVIEWLLVCYNPESQPRTLDEWMYTGFIMSAAEQRVEFLKSCQIAQSNTNELYGYIPLEKLDSVRRDLQAESDACTEVLENFYRDIESQIFYGEVKFTDYAFARCGA